MSNITITAIHDHQGLQELKPRWDSFTGSLDQTLVFFSHDWVNLWAECFIPDKKLHIIIVHEAGRIIGILPLYHETYSTLKIFKRHCLHSFTNNSATVSGIITASSDLPRVCAAIHHYLKENDHLFTELFLERLPASHTNISTLMNQFSQGWSQATLEPWPGSYYVDTTGSHADHLLSLSKRAQKNLRLKTNKLHKLKGVRWESLPSFSETAFNNLIRIENTGWKKERGNPIVQSERTLHFFKKAAEIFSGKQQFMITTLFVEDRPLIMDYSLIAYGNFHTLKIAVDFDRTDLLNLSPGSLLTEELIRYCFEHKLQRLDFYGICTEHQTHWTNRIDQKYNIMIIKRSDAIARARIYLRKLFKHEL